MPLASILTSSRVIAYCLRSLKTGQKEAVIVLACSRSRPNYERSHTTGAKLPTIQYRHYRWHMQFCQVVHVHVYCTTVLRYYSTYMYATLSQYNSCLALVLPSLHWKSCSRGTLYTLRYSQVYMGPAVAGTQPTISV